MAMVSSATPASAASRIWARLSLRAACLPPLSMARSSPRSTSLNSTRWRMFMATSSIEVAMDRACGVRQPPTAPGFTERQGQYLAFIDAYTRVSGRPPAEADLQRHFGVSAPSVHQMVVTLERAGLIRRQSGVARSIELLVDPRCLPLLQPPQPVKSSVQRD